MNDNLKVGLIVDDYLASQYIYDLAKWIKDSPNFQEPYIIYTGICNKYQKTESTANYGYNIKRFEDISVNLLTQAILKFEHKFSKKNTTDKNYNKKENLKSLGLKEITVDYTTHNSLSSITWSSNEIDKIKKIEIDILINFSEAILKDDILDFIHFGVLSCNYFGKGISLDECLGFFEVYGSKRSSEFTIEKLTKNSASPETILRGHLPTQNTWNQNKSLLIKKSFAHLKKILEELYKNKDTPKKRDQEIYKVETPSFPSIYILLNYFLQTALAIFFRKIKYKIFKHKKYWGVAFVRSSWQEAVFSNGKKIANPTKHFLADPFVVTKGGETVCFVEDFYFDENKGKISAYSIKDEGAEKLGVALDEPFHLSFPFIFEHQNTLYMCPETGQSREIRLYKCKHFPLEWSYVKSLMTHVSAADTLLIYLSQKWWMFTNICSADIGEHCSELHLFYSDDLLEKDWQPHPNNPVIFDSRRARNGGILFDKNQVYRVFQNQAKGVYGQSCGISRIDVLNEYDYQETVIREIEPTFFKGLIGTHHIHANNEYCVFDFCEEKRIYNIPS